MPHTPFSVRLDQELKDKLDTYSKAVNRSRSQVVSMALSEFLEDKKALLDGIERGLVDLEKNSVVSQGKAEQWLESIKPVDTNDHRSAVDLVHESRERRRNKTI